jgi:N-acetylglucosamine-6-phosphate deacetylase
MIVLSGARIFDGERFLDDHVLVVEGKHIAAIVPYAERPHGAVRDLAGGLLAPGYIDVQVNGGGGVLFNEDPTPEGIAHIATAHRNHGTVGLLPTLVTDAPKVMAAAIAATRERRGVLVSLGHSEAGYEEARAAVRAGARAFTHLFNAMSASVGREPGMVGAALDLADAFVGIIADGHHVHDANLRVAFAAKRRDRFMLITDAMPPAAGGPDQFDLQGRRVRRADGCLRLDDGTIAGSVLTMDEAVRYVVNVARVDLGDALAMASRIPATFLRRDMDLGRIAPGHLASLVHLDDELRVLETWIEGRPTADGF